MTWLVTQFKRLIEKYQKSLIVKASLWYITGSFVLRGLTFVSLLIFSRLLLPDQFGAVSIYLIWVSLFSVVATLYVEAAVARTKFDLPWDEFKQFVSSVAFLGLISGAVCFAVLIMLPASWIERFFTLPKPLVLLAVATGILLMSFRMTVVIWETTYNYKLNIPISLVVEATSISLSVALVLFAIGGDIDYETSLGRIAGYSLTYGLVGAYLLIYHILAGKTLVNKRFWWLAISYTLPIIPHVLASNLLSGYDRVLIAQYNGRTAAGVYAFAYQLGGISTLLWVAMNNAWWPWFFENMKQKNYAVVRLRTRQFLYAFTGLTVVLIISSPFLVNLIASPGYGGAGRVVPIVMACGLFNLLYGFYSNIEFFERKTYFVSIATILAAFANIGLNLVLIPRYGYLAAAWTTLVGYCFLFLFHALVVKFTMKELDTNNFVENILTSVGIIALVILVEYVQSIMG